MNQRSIFTAFAAAIFSLLVFTSSATAQGKGAETITTPVDVTLYNPCCDEWITFTGTVHTVVKRTFNADGTITEEFKSSVSKIRGTGLSSGIEYNGHEMNSGTATFNPGGPGLHLVQTVRTTMLGKGKGGRSCTANLTLTVHVIIDANGNLVVEEVVPTVDCPGATSIN